ncbi:nitrogen fixation protein FixH [Pseudorhodoferax sp.]|uniref:nitrogen fixation protein FixH n=1 Tax=Pseudorhodoferax sp. TaxID=1993553 RepID=UPI002DD65E9A|nr:nitrogen fixation protein FixH [Pseudorhodoferax sp.]
MQEQQTPVARPWWRYGMVWMVIGGPLVVVVAGIATAVIAFRGADPVVTAPQAQVAAEEAFDLQPAMAGRNHAATGSVPAPR